MAAPTASTCTPGRRQASETEQRIAVLAAWQEAPCYTDRERAALAWTEHLTLVAERRAPQNVYERLASGSRAEQSNMDLTEYKSAYTYRECPFPTLPSALSCDA